MRIYSNRKAVDFHRRYWWQRESPEHQPLLYRSLSRKQRSVLRAWFRDTERLDLVGETTVPLASLLAALIDANRLRRVVQLGHHAGYSSLVLGFMLQEDGINGRMASFDISEEITAYAMNWVRRAGLTDTVALFSVDSSSDDAPRLASEVFGDAQGSNLVFIDSSHAYEHTLAELDLWYEYLMPGGLLVLHDSSQFGASFDATGSGGVNRALHEWTSTNRLSASAWISINDLNRETPVSQLQYQDGCGVAIIQKPLVVERANSHQAQDT